MASFDFIAFILGFLLGAIVLLIIIWAAYYTRSFLFTYCPTQTRACGAADFFSDPGNALANDINLTPADILFLNNNEMFYKRVPRVTNCVPESNQTIYIKFPQYCSFSSATGSTGTWRETASNSNIYNPDGFVGPTITTDGNCTPVTGSPVTSGIPLIRWDANPIS